MAPGPKSSYSYCPSSNLLAKNLQHTCEALCKGEGGRNSAFLGKYLAFVVPGTSNSAITSGNFFFFFFFPLHCLGKPGTPVQGGGISSGFAPHFQKGRQLHRKGRNQARAGLLQALGMTASSSGAAAGAALRSGHLTALGHPRPAVLAEASIGSRSATSDLLPAIPPQCHPLYPAKTLMLFPT